jgi:hypothetical protein
MDGVQDYYSTLVLFHIQTIIFIPIPVFVINTKHTFSQRVNIVDLLQE